jgi:hypothetical protein
MNNEDCSTCGKTIKAGDTFEDGDYCVTIMDGYLNASQRMVAHYCEDCDPTKKAKPIAFTSMSGTEEGA